MSTRLSQTALRNAVLKAVESRQYKAKRLFEDSFARGLLNFRYRLILALLLLPRIGSIILARRERRHPGMIGNFLCRTRYIDELVCDALKNAFAQIVILGAGLDTRPYRIPGIDQTRVYEVDHPVTQKWKMKRVIRILGKVPAHVTFVAADFDQQRLAELMQKTDFDLEAKTLFIWEGVSQYITPAAVDAIFRYLRCVATPDSRIIFTYINSGIIEGIIDLKGSTPLLPYHESLNEPWIFGVDPEDISSFLEARGFKLLTQADATEYRKRYLLPIDRQMNVFPGEFTALLQGK